MHPYCPNIAHIERSPKPCNFACCAFDVCIERDSYLLIILMGREPFSYFPFLFAENIRLQGNCVCACEAFKQTQQTNWRASNSIFFQFPQLRGCRFPFNFNGTLEMSFSAEPVAFTSVNAADSSPCRNCCSSGTEMHFQMGERFGCERCYFVLRKSLWPWKYAYNLHRHANAQLLNQ